MKKNGIMKELIARFATDYENNIAFTVYDGMQITEITYQNFAKDILRVVGYFVSNQIKGQHIAIAARNSYDWLVTYYAVIGSGNVAVLINQDLSADILEWQCVKADVSLICTDNETVVSMRRAVSNVECVSFCNTRFCNAVSLDMLYNAEPDDTIQMLFTSGTTGKSKAVEHTSNNWKYMMTSHDVRLASKEMNRISIPVPFYHSLGLESVNISLFYGKTVCIGRGIKYLFSDMVFLNPDLMVAVPSILESLVKILRRATSSEERRKYIGDNLRHIGYAGAVLKEPVLRTLLDQGFVISVNFGMSEIPGASTMCIIENEEHYRSAGKFTPNTEFCFKNGELLLKSPRVMKGYYKDPEETANVIIDGWLYTGDLGCVNENGYFYLTGRKKNVIILSNGENVNPEEIETILGSCSDVLECMVYSDEKGICADVYTENREKAEVFIKGYNKITKLYRQVYKVNFYDKPLEKTGSGKIKRKVNIYV